MRTTEIQIMAVQFACWLFPCPIAPAAQQAPADETQSARRAVVDNVEFLALLEKAPSLDPVRAKELVGYLAHSDEKVRHRALRVLAHVPAVAPAALTIALASKDVELRGSALHYSRPYLENSEVQRTWIECFTGPIPGTDDRTHAYDMFMHLDQSVRALVAVNLIPKILERLDSFKPRAEELPLFVTLLGRIAEPGNAQVLNALADLDRVREHPPQNWKSPFGAERTSDEMAALGVALEFAQGNLGDESALRRFMETATTGEISARLARMRCLPKFRPTPALLKWVESLLADHTPIQNITMSVDPPQYVAPAYRHTVDFAIDALGQWYPDFPFHNNDPGLTYQNSDIEKAREWLGARRP